MSKVSIIIPVYNNCSYTKACLESIYQETDKKKFEIIVIDNNSKDETNYLLNKFRDKYSNFNFIKNDENFGFAKACNQGSIKAKYNKLLFLNNDTLVTKEWLEPLVAELKNNIKITASKLLYEDDTIQHAGMVFNKNKLEDGFHYPYHIYRFFHKNHPAVNKKRKFKCVTGACFLIDKSIFEELNGLDENYINGFEDTDLCLKLIQAGYEIMYCPDSEVYHYESKTAGRYKHTKQNYDLFVKRWKNKIIPDDYQFYKADKIKNHYQMIDTNNLKNLSNIDKFISNGIYENTSENQEILIIGKNYEKLSKKEMLLSISNININSKKSFKMLINFKEDKLKEWQNIENISFSNMSLSEIKNYFEKINLKKVIFLDISKYNDFDITENRTGYNINQIENILIKLSKKELSENEIKEITENLLSALKNNLFFISNLVKNLNKLKKYSKSLDLLQYIVKSNSINLKDIKELLSYTVKLYKG